MKGKMMRLSNIILCFFIIALPVSNSFAAKETFVKLKCEITKTHKQKAEYHKVTRIIEIVIDAKLVRIYEDNREIGGPYRLLTDDSIRYVIDTYYGTIEIKKNLGTYDEETGFWSNRGSCKKYTGGF